MLGDSVRRRQPGKGGKTKVSASPAPRRARRKWSRRRWLIGLPLALVLPFAIGYLVAVFVLFPPREASGVGIPVPDLVGSTTAEAQRALVAAGLGPLEVSELPHPLVSPGEVVAQSPLAGQQLHGGGIVRVAVSAGRARVLVPDVAGFSPERAESLLRRAGFSVIVATMESQAPAGRVIRTEPQPGHAAMLPAEVTVFVSSGPPEPVEPDPALPDTLPPPGQPDGDAVLSSMLRTD